MEAPAAAWPRAARTACSSDMRASAGIRGRPFGHASERATQRLKAENAFVLVRRSCRGGARALPRHSELWSLARTRRGNLGFGSSPATSHPNPARRKSCTAGPRRRLRSSSGGDAVCERNWFSRLRSWRRRASEAGARASTSRDSYPSTRVVGAGRAGPSTSASDAMGERPGLESGGSHRAPRARCFMHTL